MLNLLWYSIVQHWDVELGMVFQWQSRYKATDMIFDLLYVWIWLALLVSETLENKQNSFGSTIWGILTGCYSELYKWVHFLGISWNISQLYNCWCFFFHTIRGIVIKQWAASVIYFVGNFHHFVKKMKIKECFVTNSFFL
jgi:hypothetical protein